MNFKTILVTTVAFCALTFQSSAVANDFSISQLLAETLHKQSSELQVQMKQNATVWLRHMAQQVALSMDETVDGSAAMVTKVEDELPSTKHDNELNN